MQATPPTRSRRPAIGFFGTISKGMASVIEYAFQQQGRPNGYILGQDAGGAFVAGLRYGEGTLYTRDAGTHRVYWQGPSIGWDAGAAGSKVMVLIYNLRDPEEHLSALRRGRRLGLRGRWRGLDLSEERRCRRGADPRRRRPSSRCQHRLFEVYPNADLEPVLRGAEAIRSCVTSRRSAPNILGVEMLANAAGAVAATWACGFPRLVRFRLRAPVPPRMRH